MNDLIDFLTSEEMIIVGVIALIGCFLAFMVFLFEKRYNKRRLRQNTKELNNLVEEVSKVSEKLPEVIDAVSTDNSSMKEEEVPTIKEDTSDIKIEKLDDVPIVEKVAPIVEEKKEEKPLVIPIEQLEEENSSTSIENIYSDVKEHIETLDEESEELKYTSVEPNQEEAREELRKVTEDLIKKEEQLNDDNIELTKFEEEQEENAIISLDELMKKSNELYEKNEVTQYEDEGNEPISLQDLELRMNNIQEEIKELDLEEVKSVERAVEPVSNNEKVVLDDFNTITDPDKLYRNDVVFKSSPIISPIFGIENKIPSSTDIALENTANYEKLDEEIKKTNEFLVTLKELQKKLD